MLTLLNSILLSLYTLAGSGCTKGSMPGRADSMPVLAAEERKNLAYGPDPKQSFDMYLPAGRSADSTPVLVLIHGGGWVGGDKSSFQSAVEAFKKQLPHYAIFNLNYRLASFSGQNLWPTQINDVNAAIAHIAGRADSLGINADKMVLAGASAGAHLAMLHAYKHDTAGRVQVVADMFGPTDMVELVETATDPNYPFLIGLFLNGTPASNPASYASASPYVSVSAKAPATIIFHGAKDKTVPPAQSEKLYQKLRSLGVTTEYVVYPGEGHGWYGNNLNDTYQKMVNFIRQNMD